MNRLSGKVAIVTGASVGIGAAISKSLVKHGVKVVGLARRLDKLQELSAALGKDKFYAVQCDLGKEEDILSAFKWVEKVLGGADILINNAGVATSMPIIDSPTSEYYKLININVVATAICAREFAQSIKKRNACGHIININSIAGHFAEALTIPLGLYTATKYGQRALGTELRHEFIASKLKIKLTNISPGAVLTDMIRDVLNDESGKKIFPQVLKDEDVATAVIYALETPEGVEIHEITIMAENTAISITNS
ncbi:farnesol dehydrogenase-like [Calliopsis andreniformis]|uniref:farnesol dehydrogenase-like n=1 Tax=Calliopsis andreniformis TaxID=337506 RepID=UPI003FCDF882